jgi:hypothetical protein
MCITLYYLTHKQLKKNIKRSSDPKINQNLALKKKSSFLQTQKVSKSNTNSFVTFCPNVNDSFSIPRIFFGDVSISNNCTWKILQNIPKILPQSPCMKSWYHDKFHDFLNLFAFNGILERFVQTVLSFVREQDLRNLLPFQAYVITLNSLLWKSFSIRYTQLFKTLPV